MNYKFLKLTALLSAGFLVCIIESCVKATSYFTDLSQTSDMVILRGAGLSNFKASNLLVNTSSPDTLFLPVTVELASSNSDGGAVNVTLGLDNSVIATYNAANHTNFQPFPTDAFKFVNTSVTIPGGLNHYGTTTVYVFQDKLDPSVSYMLPVAITDAGGKQLSGNQNIIYYNVIGNPLAGNYLQDFHRWNGTTDTTTAPNSTNYYDNPIVVGPITATTVLLPEDYLETFVGVGVNLSFTNNNGVLSNIAVSLDQGALADIAAGGFTIVTPPTLVGYAINGDANTKYAGSWFRIYMVVINSSGATRTLIDEFTKQ